MIRRPLHPSPAHALLRSRFTIGGLTLVALTAAGCTITTAPGGPSDLPANFAVVGLLAPTGTPIDAVACGLPLHCIAVGLPPAAPLPPSPTTTAPAATTAPTTTAASATSSTVPASTTTTTQPGPQAGILVTSDGGAAWSRERVPTKDPTNLDAVACSGATTCVVAGSATSSGTPVGLMLAESKGNWTSVTIPTSGSIAAVSCPSIEDCTAVASNGSSWWSVSSTNAGKSWTRGGNLAGAISGLACPAIGDCVAVGDTPTTPGKGNGAIDLTTNSGTTWGSSNLPPTTGVLHAVACPSTTHCLAVGTSSTVTTNVTSAPAEVLASTNAGRTWVPTNLPTAIDDAFAVSCASALVCAAVGTAWVTGSPVAAVVTTGTAGRHWRYPKIHYVPVGLTGVACPWLTGCVAVGGDTLARMALPPPHP